MRAFGGSRRIRVRPRPGPARVELYHRIQEAEGKAALQDSARREEARARRAAERELEQERSMTFLQRLKRAIPKLFGRQHRPTPRQA